jgi:hypothetical protein
MRAAYDHEDVPHTLLPLVLAVGLVRHKVYDDQPLTDQGREGDFSMLANFMAEIIPIYEYSLDASRSPRVLGKHELGGGMFRDGAKELRFIDGRPPLLHMAVNATDVECVLSLLRARSARRRSTPTSCAAAPRNSGRAPRCFRRRRRRCDTTPSDCAPPRRRRRVLPARPRAGPRCLVRSTVRPRGRCGGGRRAAGGWTRGAGRARAG